VKTAHSEKLEADKGRRQIPESPAKAAQGPRQFDARLGLCSAILQPSKSARIPETGREGPEHFGQDVRGWGKPREVARLGHFLAPVYELFQACFGVS